MHVIKPVDIGKLNDAVIEDNVTAHSGNIDPLADIIITEKYKLISQLIDSGNKVTFVTGKAGTGKSTFIKYLKHTIKKHVVVVAPTGIAALNVKGSTIHSFFRLPPKIIEESDIKAVYDRKLYRKLDLLIIDEISMVRADLLDAIDLFLKKNRESKKLFGGVQILLIGDLFQLPPIVHYSERKLLQQKGYKSEFFFSAFSLQNTEMIPIELKHVFRQEELTFVKTLDNIRQAKNLDFALEKINSKYISIYSPNKEVTLTCTNDIADSKNNNELERLSTAKKIFNGKIEGKFNLKENKLPSPMKLTLKIGAQVMFTKNDRQKRWVNGSLGVVENFTQEGIAIRLYEATRDPIVIVKKETWKNYGYEYNPINEKIISKVIGKYTQYPLMLAWAVTIHKSQGKTLPKVFIDLGYGAFAPGQVYVALSRVKSLNDIHLARPIKNQEIHSDRVVNKFYRYIFNIPDDEKDDQGDL